MKMEGKSVKTEEIPVTWCESTGRLKKKGGTPKKGVNKKIGGDIKNICNNCEFQTLILFKNIYSISKFYIG